MQWVGRDGLLYSMAGWTGESGGKVRQAKAQRVLGVE